MQLVNNVLFHPWPRDYKAFFVLNASEHDISTAHDNLKNEKKEEILPALKHPDLCCIYPVNNYLKMTTTDTILTFTSKGFYNLELARS